MPWGIAGPFYYLFLFVSAFQYLVNIELHFMEIQGRVVCMLFGMGTKPKISADAAVSCPPCLQRGVLSCPCQRNGCSSKARPLQHRGVGGMWSGLASRLHAHITNKAELPL